jgi:hypothetical protein
MASLNKKTQYLYLLGLNIAYIAKTYLNNLAGEPLLNSDILLLYANMYNLSIVPIIHTFYNEFWDTFIKSPEVP